MKYQVITIHRDFAAYGRTIARALSEALGLPWYDRDFVTKTALESGFESELIREEGENLSHRSKWVDSIMSTVHSGYNSSHDDIFRAQSKVILELSAKPCIIVGRCSNYVLKMAEVPTFDIYLYASRENRRQRASELLPDEDKSMDPLAGKKLDPVKDAVELDKYIARRDDLRRTYYKKYTGSEIDSASNYNICLDVGTLGVDRCVQILLEILK